MRLLDIFMNMKQSESKNDNDDNWFLTDEEKKEVNSGNYENFNFEEEDTEEDDYYHDDVE